MLTEFWKNVKENIMSEFLNVIKTYKNVKSVVKCLSLSSLSRDPVQLPDGASVQGLGASISSLLGLRKMWTLQLYKDIRRKINKDNKIKNCKDQQRPAKIRKLSIAKQRPILRLAPFVQDRTWIECRVSCSFASYFHLKYGCYALWTPLAGSTAEGAPNPHSKRTDSVESKCTEYTHDSCVYIYIQLYNQF